MTAVYELLDRLVPNQRGNFTFGLAPTAGCGSTKPPCYTVTAKEGDVSISGSGVRLSHLFWLPGHIKVTIYL